MFYRTPEQDSGSGRLSQPSFREDARWNSDRQAVDFGVEIGEYHGVVRLPRCSNAYLPGRPILLMSLGQTLFHRYLGHRGIGGRFFRNYLDIHHRHYSGKPYASASGEINIL